MYHVFARLPDGSEITIGFIFSHAHAHLLAKQNSMWEVERLSATGALATYFRRRKFWA